MMRLIMRILGTWMIGLAVVLLVIDGTRSLAADALVLASLADVWAGLDTASLAQVESFLSTRFFADLLGRVLDALLAAPAFAVIGLSGIALALVGRKKRPARFVHTNQV